MHLQCQEHGQILYSNIREEKGLTSTILIFFFLQKLKQFYFPLTFAQIQLEISVKQFTFGSTTFFTLHITIVNSCSLTTISKTIHLASHFNVMPDTFRTPNYVPIVRIACAPIVETRFIELAMSLLDF